MRLPQVSSNIAMLESPTLVSSMLKLTFSIFMRSYSACGLHQLEVECLAL